MDHPVTVGAQQDEVAQLGFGLARRIQRPGMVNFDVFTTAIAVDPLEVESTYLAVNTGMLLEEGGDLLAT